MRQRYLADLIEVLDISLISYDFLKENVLCDELLQSNKRFAAKTAKIKKEIMEKDLNVALGYPSPKNLACVVNTITYKFDSEVREWCSYIEYDFNNIYYSIAPYKNGFYFSGSETFSFYDMKFNKTTSLPNMPIAIYYHGSIQVNKQIYVCGGQSNNAAVESTNIFDIGSAKWTKGSDMEEPRYKFGMAASGKLDL